MKKIRNSKQLEKGMAISLAAMNLLPTTAPLAALIAQAEQGMPSEWELAKLHNGGQILDKLFFSTAYAGTSISTSVSVSAGESSTNDTIVAGGEQHILSGGSAMSATINSSGKQYVSADGNAKDTTINGGQQNVKSGGSATGTTIHSGVQAVSSGGSTTSTTIYSGYQDVLSSGSATGTTINGGQQSVYAGGSATSTTINAGTQSVAGGSATSTTINAGTQIVKSGGSATSTTIYSGGGQMVEGIATSTTINSLGVQTVLNGATVTDTTVNSGGTIRYGSGAVLSGTTSAAAGSIIRPWVTNQSAGAALTIANLQGSTNFYINTDLANNTADKITITSGTSGAAHGIGVNYDPCYDAGTGVKATSSGGVTFAEVPKGTTFTPLDTEYSAYIFTPVITSDTTGSNDMYNITEITAQNKPTPPQPPKPQPPKPEPPKPEPPTPEPPTPEPPTPEPPTPEPPTPEPPTPEPPTPQPPTPEPVLRPSEAAKASADMMAGTTAAIRIETNNVMKRMGELRHNEADSGTWARVYSGKLDSDLGGRSAEQKYNAIQVGYDRRIKQADGAWFVGGAIGYLKGDANMERSEGKTRSTSLALYGTKLYEKGHYLDIIAKQSRIGSEYTSYLNNPQLDNRLTGDYDNWSTTLSVEYGYRKQLGGGVYIEPQLELGIGRINSASYRLSDGTNVHNDAMKSLLGRIGVAYGKDDGRRNYYAKVSAVREFTAEARTTLQKGVMSSIAVEHDLKESWLEFALGLTSKMSDRSDGYVEVTTTTGTKTKMPWQVNMGMRWSF